MSGPRHGFGIDERLAQPPVYPGHYCEKGVRLGYLLEEIRLLREDVEMLRRELRDLKARSGDEGD